MNNLFDGKTLCSDTPADCLWLDVLYEAAGVERRLQFSPLSRLLAGMQLVRFTIDCQSEKATVRLRTPKHF
ncbi:hypothetical protein CF161_01195 [Pseudomonas sp. CF161]|nr:hypothetical protein CF161_01195 [Pseudomonas sp. CF161]